VRGRIVNKILISPEVGLNFSRAVVCSLRAYE